MPHRSAWIRGLAAAIAWTAVTAVAAAGSWFGMSAVFAADSASTTADTVIPDPTDSRSPQQAPQEPSPTPDETEEVVKESSPAPATSEPPVEQWNGWTKIGTDTYERTFSTDGGTAVVQLRPDQAILVSASPAEGYTAATEQPEPARLVVSFYTGGSTVTVDTMWWNNEPYGQVSRS